jgi:ketosteroid isomerase-like protein
MGEEDGKVKQMVSTAKRRVGAETPRVTEDDDSERAGIVRGALQAFGQGDMDGFVDTLKGDIMWENPEGENFPGCGDLSGPDEVRERFIGDVGRTYTSFGFRPESFMETDHEDAVVVIGRFEGEGVTGDSVDTPGIQIWGFQGNEVTQVRVFADTAAFPEVVTEEKEKEWAEEDKKKEEEEKKDDSDDSDDDGDSKSEKKSEDDSDSEDNGSSPKAKSKDDSDDDSDSDDEEDSKSEKKSDDDSDDDDS